MRAKSSYTKLREQIADIRVAMLTTVDELGDLRSRPMATLELGDDGDLWFFTRCDAPKVEETEREHRVNVAYAAPPSHRYVSVSGRAQLVHDREKIRRLWRPAHRLYFPDGPDDPALALLCVTPKFAEFWCTPPTLLGRAVHLLRTALAGQSPQPGSHEKLAF